MSIFFIIVAVVVALYMLFRQQKLKGRRDAIRLGEVEVLMHWTYSPEDWDWYAGDPSSRWIKHRGVPGEVFITRESIYVTNGRDDYLFEFGDEKRITQCSFFHSFLDLRAESALDYEGDLLNNYQREQTGFQHEDFRLYVPKAHQEKGSQLVARFKSLAEANSEYAQKFVKGDEIIPLFGNPEDSKPQKVDKYNDDEIISLFGNDEA